MTESAGMQSMNGARTPRHNGRTDEQGFYKKMRLYGLEDGRKQLTKYNKKSNDIPEICLDNILFLWYIISEPIFGLS